MNIFAKYPLIDDALEELRDYGQEINRPFTAAHTQYFARLAELMDELLTGSAEEKQAFILADILMSKSPAYYSPQDVTRLTATFGAAVGAMMERFIEGGDREAVKDSYPSFAQTERAHDAMHVEARNAAAAAPKKAPAPKGPR